MELGKAAQQGRHIVASASAIHEWLKKFDRRIDVTKGKRQPSFFDGVGYALWFVRCECQGMFCLEQPLLCRSKVAQHAIGGS